MIKTVFVIFSALILDKVTLGLKVMPGFTFKLLVVNLNSVGQYRTPKQMRNGQVYLYTIVHPPDE